MDSNAGIIAGHGRLLAARKLELDEVPVVLDHLTEQQKRAYIIADNKIGLNAEWDEELLPLQLAELKDQGFDVDLIGFSSQELDALLVHAAESHDFAAEDAVPEPLEDPISRRGDLWLLGDHRLLCGDSASREDVDRLVEGAPVDLVNTDPPYNVKVEPRPDRAVPVAESAD